MKNKMKVICLHGCNQTPTSFQSYMNSIVKMAKNKIEFIFIQAPFEHPLGGLCWTDPPLNVNDIYRINNGAFEPAIERNDKMLQTSFQLLEKTIEETGAEILLGFSQGAFVINEFMLQGGDVSKRIKKIITIAGFAFRDSYDKHINNCSALIVSHPMDSIVPHSIAFHNFDKVTQIEHNNKELKYPSREGHVIPTRAEHTRAITNFILTP